MKVGRTIRLESDFFRNIRTNLRKFFYKVLEDEFDRLLDQAHLQSSLGNWLGVQKLNNKANEAYELLYNSICRCFDCNSFESDAVFFSEEIYYPIYYPPVDTEIKAPETYWLCPRCYKLRIERLEKWKKENYYYFHRDGVVATLGQLGLGCLDDY